ncbi:glycosyltransferase [Streptomyces sp. S1]|uniref:glycosyltransferase n=1 Tax=Streptomyces sp. S1 TaxID=718288 RepID=UPI003D7637F5
MTSGDLHNTPSSYDLVTNCQEKQGVTVSGRHLEPQLANRLGYWQLEYLHDDIPHALALKDLVIGRAGATTLAELAALELPAVLVPLPASVSRGDQLDNNGHLPSGLFRIGAPWTVGCGGSIGTLARICGAPPSAARAEAPV